MPLSGKFKGNIIFNIYKAIVEVKSVQNVTKNNMFQN